ncbi:MAG: GntR family transcriptional regulator [Verrucomicrobiales bacterium]|jgi:LacI family transcriptional regulator|nr:GntR family transcriptional regulator [Verrucomicrobiales bacterium]
MASAQNHNLGLSLAASELKQPLHSKVRQVLRERILHDFKHGQRFYSERELMQKLNVSQATIRRAIMDLVDEGYLQADPRRGFFVQRLQSTRYVGLVSPAAGMRLVMASAEFAEICRRHNYILNIYGFHKTETVDDIMRAIQRKPSEERILLTGLTVDLTLELGLRLKSEGYQHAVVGARIAGFTGGSVAQDHDAEVDMILDYLSKLGHKRILFLVNEPKNLLITNLRAEKIQQRLIERNLAEAQLVFCDTRNWGDSFEAAYKKTHSIMQSKNVPTAIVPLSGVGSWAVLRYAIEHDIKIPQQLSIIGFDPMINADILPIPLTELTFSQEERAEKSLKILWSEQPALLNELVTPKLVIRASTAAPAMK